MQKASPDGKKTYLTKEDGEFLIKAVYRGHLNLKNLVTALGSGALSVGLKPVLDDSIMPR